MPLFLNSNSQRATTAVKRGKKTNWHAQPRPERRTENQVTGYQGGQKEAVSSETRSSRAAAPAKEQPVTFRQNPFK